MNQQYVVVTERVGETKVEICSTLDNARRVATKWCSELNCTVHIARVMASCSRVTEWAVEETSGKPGAES